MSAVFINRSASFLPNAPVDNATVEKMLGATTGHSAQIRRIVLRQNGIRQRYYALDPHRQQPTHSNAQLAANAIRALFADAQRPDIGCLAVGTSLADQLMPGHAVMVHGELGWPACEVATLAGICCAGMAALKFAWLQVALGECQHAVAAASELSSAMLRQGNYPVEGSIAAEKLHNEPELAFGKEFLRWMLSDGAGALWLGALPQPERIALRIDWIEMSSHAHLLPACMYMGARKQGDGSLLGWTQADAVERDQAAMFCLTQDVRLLNENVVEHTLVQPLSRIRQKRRLESDAIDWFLPHMSSEYFRQPIAAALSKIGLPIAQERWYTNLKTCGNTGSASIYIMLDELIRSGTLRPGERLLCFIPESGRFSSAFMHLTVT